MLGLGEGLRGGLGVGWGGDRVGLGQGCRAGPAERPGEGWGVWGHGTAFHDGGEANVGAPGPQVGIAGGPEAWLCACPPHWPLISGSEPRRLSSGINPPLLGSPVVTWPLCPVSSPCTGGQWRLVFWPTQ